MEKIDKKYAIDILEQIALLLELKNANVFKIRAFENAVRVLEGHPNDLKTLIETGELEQLKGIGKGISAILHDLYEKGRSKDFEELKKGVPETLFDVFRIPGLGPKRIKILYEKLKIKSVAELEKACKENKLLPLDGFGTKSQEKILQGISQAKQSDGQYLIHIAREESDRIVAYLKNQKGISKIEVAGSIRRAKEIIRDIDILVCAKNPEAIHKAFVGYSGVRAVVAQGDTKSSVTLRNGMNCDLRTVTEEEFPYALYYFTGSKEHNVAVRTIAKKKGIKVNEYGLYKGKRKLPCKDEAELFQKLGFSYIPPEARENTGEIELASKGPFPPLVEEKDLRGVFHVHSTYSDGVAPLEEMIATAEKMGLEYVGISDHSQSATYAKGLQPERVRAQWKEIEKMRKKFKIRIFKGIESDILGDGKLDYKDDILREFDFVIGSVHSRFTMSEKEMTTRICRAMDHPAMTFLGHPTGRLLLTRNGYSVDMIKVIDHAKKTGVVVEINAHPNRLDLDWRLCHYARKQGVPMSINPDAHSVKGMQDISYGIGIARKGWLEKKHVVNTMPLAQMEKFLMKRK